MWTGKTNQISTTVQHSCRLLKLSWQRLPKYMSLCPQLQRHISSGDDKGEHIPSAGSYRSPWKILKEEFKAVKEGGNFPPESPVPRETDMLVIGGGIIGSAVAYFLKQRNPKGFSLTVIERDPSYTQASSMLSAGGIRHQFSLAENVELSMFTTKFLRDIKKHLSVLDQDPPDVQFNHQGYMFLASPENAEYAAECVKMQRELGAKIELLTRDKLAQKFPWLNLDGVEVGSYGIEGEGWFDPWSLVKALKQKNIQLGVKYIQGEVTDFTFKEISRIVGDREEKRDMLENVVVKYKDGRTYNCRFALCINCAGPWARDIAMKAGIGNGPNECMVPLPVEPRKRFVYVIHSPDGPGLETPFTVDACDSQCLYFRREGVAGHYICGMTPTQEEEPDINNLDVDFDFFQNQIWPKLMKRVPKFEKLKVKSAWAGYYDYNTMDQNLIIGNHPYHANFFFANGLSGHGVQHALGIGRAMMEFIIDNDYKTIDLSRFSFDRVLYDEPLLETGIV